MMNQVEKKASTKKSLPAHIEQKINLKTGNEEYHCTICQKSFQSRTQKYYHYGCGNDNLRHKCKFCGKSLATRSHLAYHLETHNDATYQCQDCNKTFTNRLVLQKHKLQIHQRTTTYLCEFCNKEFKNKETLNAHTARHNNELNFECGNCNAKYATKSALEQHKLSHVAKKHECPQCGKRFQRNSILNLHLKRHRNTDLHLCTICSKKCSDMVALQRHIKTHRKDGQIKFRCIECDIVSLRKDNMQRHVRNMHINQKFEECIEIIMPKKEKSQLTLESNESNLRIENLWLNEEPKTVANSSVIKCIGNVEPITVPNNSILEEIEAFDISTPAQEVFINAKKLKKRYDPIEMYRKIIGTEDNEDEDYDEDEDGTAVKRSVAINVESENAEQIVEKPRSTAINISNFSEMHWRKNFKYTYQHQEY